MSRLRSFAIASTLLIAACSSKPTSKFPEGSWKSTLSALGTTQILLFTFRPDHTYDASLGGSSSSGTWSSDGKIVKMSEKAGTITLEEVGKTDTKVTVKLTPPNQSGQSALIDLEPIQK